MFLIYETHEYSKRLIKIASHSEIEAIEKYKDRLQHTLTIGKPLGPIWLREFKIGVKRIYFITGKTSAILVWAGTKQTQKEDIKTLRNEALKYKVYLNERDERDQP